MPRCSRFSEDLAQFVADGEPQTKAYAPLLRHLAACPSCREEAGRLSFIEQVLQGYPRRAADPTLTARILERIAHEQVKRERVDISQGRVLTWEVWLPGLTLLLAVSILALSIPEQTVAVAPLLGLDPGMLRHPVSLPEILPGLRVLGGDTLFWALWSAFFAVVSGMGLWMSLNAWNANSARAVDQLEGQVSGLFQRLTDRFRQAH